jgi:hypothetical protein
MEKKPNKIIPKQPIKDDDITYEIPSNDSANDEELHISKSNTKKQLAKYISVPEEFPVKMILGSPSKIRATASRIIKAGAKGKINQQVVNSLIWQLRSLVYFDQINADLTYIQRIEALERELKRQERQEKL